jgi:hypothetical protein
MMTEEEHQPHAFTHEDQARQEWEQMKALMRGRAALLVPPEERFRGRGWTRDEIYEERWGITQQR